MQAIVLVGGEGTRLRPLTDDVPKPALTLVDRPFLAYMIEWLARHGVDEVGPRLRLPARRAARGARRGRARRRPAHLRGRARAARHRRARSASPPSARRPPRGPLPRPQRRRAHRPRPQRPAALARASAGRAATLGPQPVEDSSAYGLVACDDDGRRPRVPREDRASQVPGEINAGAYVLERSVLELIPAGREVSIEREVFPRLVGDGLYGAARSTATGWTSARRERYLQASWDILEGRVETEVRADRARALRRRRRGGRHRRQDRSARSRLARLLGRRRRRGRANRSCFDGCAIGEGARVSGSILAAGVTVAAGAKLVDTVVGRDERVPVQTS